MIAVENLSQVAETMLWPLYGRVAEAQRPDAKLDDPMAIRIADAIDYDFAQSFGKPDFGHAARALAIDGVLRSWIVEHPDGQVVALGDGLETQFWRVDNGQLDWLSVDLPEAIALRQQLLGESSRRRDIACAITDLTWMNQVDPSRDLFITAAGVLMYLEPSEVQTVIAAIAERFPAAEMIFDCIPHWLSDKTTTEGWDKTPTFRMPPMPWGLDRNESDQLRDWHPNITEVRETPFRQGRGLSYGGVLPLLRGMPKSAKQTPFLLHLICS